MVLIFVLIVFVIIIIVTNNKPLKESSYTITVDFPNPEKAHPKRVIDAIDKLTYIELLHVREALMDMNIFFPENGLSQAYDEKVLQGDNFNKEKYYKIFNIKTPKIGIAPNGSVLDPEFFIKKNHKKIERQYLYPKKNIKDKTHFFYNKKVVITGEFSSHPFRNKMARLLWQVGADIDTTISIRTDYVIVGENPGWKKLETIKQLNIKIITNEKFSKIFN